MKSLFTEMEKEIASDRLAAKREWTQRAREYLRAKHGIEKFVMDHLTANGPSVDANMMLALSELGAVKQCLEVITVVWALWATGRLWREGFPNHPSNEECFLYGIRGVHARKKKHAKGATAEEKAGPSRTPQRGVPTGEGGAS